MIWLKPDAIPAVTLPTYPGSVPALVLLVGSWVFGRQPAGIKLEVSTLKIYCPSVVCVFAPQMTRLCCFIIRVRYGFKL